MNFGHVRRSFKSPTRITFSCSGELAKKIKEHAKNFNHCQSDLIAQAVKELIERIERDTNKH